MHTRFLQLAKGCPTWHLEDDVLASTLVTYRIGGTIRYLFTPDTAKDLISLCEALRAYGIDFRIIGAGSNVLPSDTPYNGAWIRTKRIAGIRVFEPYVCAEAGVSLNLLIRKMADLHLGGLENLYGIPASIGGAAVMNAGANGTQIADLIQSVTVYDPLTHTVTELQQLDCGFGYRESIFQSSAFIVLSATLRFTRARRDLILAHAERMQTERRGKQPLSYPSAGSTFRRPCGRYAGKLIADAGCKGLRVGDACVSPKHAGFIVNLGHATARDVLSLIAEVQDRVFNQTGVFLMPEIKIW